MRFASFYAKRARRILPASFVVLSLSVVAALIWYPPLLMREVWQGALATAFYVPNMLFAAQGTNYLAETTPSLFQHYWSLGIEEQFYLAWPLVLSLGFVFVRRPKFLFMLISGLVIVSFVACVLLTFRSQPWAFFALPTRAWELGVGGLAAFILTYRPQVLTGRTAAITGWMGIATLAGSVLLFTSETLFPGYWAVVPVVATAAVIVAGDSRAPLSPQAILSTRGMQFIGLISYSLYLVHWPLLQIPQAAVGFENPLPLWATLILGAISFPVAWLLFRYVEEPGRTVAWLAAARPRRSLIAAGAASVLVAVAATGAHLYSESKPLHAGDAATSAEVTSPPNFTTFVPSNLAPSLRSVSKDQPQVYEDGCHLNFTDTVSGACVYGDENAPQIALFGDSHAAQWFPALLTFAEEHGYSVASYTKSACPSVSASVLRNGSPYSECSQWRDSTIEILNATQPALVVVSNSGNASLADAGTTSTWGQALGGTIGSLRSPVAVIADTPNLGNTPAVCLSANLHSAQECGAPRDVALGSPESEEEQRVTQELGVPYVDLNDYICSEELCSPIVGNTLAYRDAHHLTATFSAQLSEVLGERLTLILN